MLVFYADGVEREEFLEQRRWEEMQGVDVQARSEEVQGVEVVVDHREEKGEGLPYNDQQHRELHQSERRR